MDVIRIPFDWERLRPVKDGALDTVELGRIRAVVDHARTLGLKVVLDPHNFGYFLARWPAEAHPTLPLPISGDR
jgi:endoglucanase